MLQINKAYAEKQGLTWLFKILFFDWLFILVTGGISDFKKLGSLE
jgi:hypothetical protein